MDMPKAYSYVRFSSAKQMLGDSLRRQTALAIQYAEAHGLKLDEKLTYRDLGISAFDKSNQERGALSLFLDAVRAGKIAPGSYLLVEQFDRLSRTDVWSSLNLLRELITAGIRLVTLSDGRLYDLESLDDLGNLMFTVGVMFRAHEESSAKSKRIKAAWHGKRERHEAVMTSECPRWLKVKKDKKGFEVIPEKAESVKKVFFFTERGLGSVAIARMANAEKWPVPGKAESWHPSLIPKLLRNRAVLGEFHPKIKRDGKRIEIGDPWPDYFPKLIEIEQFNVVAALKRDKKRIPNRRDSAYRNIFQGFLHCGECGASFIRKNKTSTKSPGYAIYMCASRVRGLTKCLSMSPQKFEKSLIAHIYENGFSEVTDDDLAEHARQKLASAEEQLRLSQAKIDRLVDAIADGTSSANIHKRITALEAEHAEYEKEVEEKRGWVASLKGAYELDERLTDLENTLRKIDEPGEVEFRASLHSRFTSAILSAWIYPQEECIVVRWRGATSDTIVKLSDRSQTTPFEKKGYEPPQKNNR